ncbi:MAG: rod shape-determining protein RodA [bacterium]|nr:rod shape-determining protein RodA [bacterium]
MAVRRRRQLPPRSPRRFSKRKSQRVQRHLNRRSQRLAAIDRRLIQNFEWPIFVMGLSLAIIGVVNLISASPEQTGGIPDTAWRQLIWTGVGLGALVVTLLLDYRNLQRLAFPLYFLCIGLLAAVLLTGPIIGGSQRWLVFGSIRLQPSEPTKLAVMILFARLLARRTSNAEIGLTDLVAPALLMAVPAALVLRQPDLGTTLLILIVPGTYLLVARVRIRSLVSLAAAGAAAALTGWFFYLHDYQKERVLTFLNPERDPLGAAYHAIQSRIAVGSGGLFGKGYLRGPQSQLDFLPEQQTDFVFSVLAEEWGFVGAGAVLLLYLGMMIRGLMIAHASRDLFGTYLAVGVVALFFWAGAINVGMVVGVLPVVGVPLPMLSYGGSSLLTCMIGLGLLMNISMRRYIF